MARPAPTKAVFCWAYNQNAITEKRKKKKHPKVHLHFFSAGLLWKKKENE